MADDRSCGFFGFGNEFIWIIVVIILILLLFPGLFGGYGYRE